MYAPPQKNHLGSVAVRRYKIMYRLRILHSLIQVESLLRAVSVDAEGNLSYEQLVDMLAGLAK